MSSSYSSAYHSRGEPYDSSTHDVRGHQSSSYDSNRARDGLSGSRRLGGSYDVEGRQSSTPPRESGKRTRYDFEHETEHRGYERERDSSRDGYRKDSYGVDPHSSRRDDSYSGPDTYKRRRSLSRERYDRDDAPSTSVPASHGTGEPARLASDEVLDQFGRIIKRRPGQAEPSNTPGTDELREDASSYERSRGPERGRGRGRGRGGYTGSRPYIGPDLDTTDSTNESRSFEREYSRSGVSYAVGDGDGELEEGEVRGARSTGVGVGGGRESGTSTQEDGAAEVEEMSLESLLGFGSFGSTAGKPVEDNQTTAAKGAVAKVVTKSFRQYMNRKGGFNRPLDKLD